MWDSLPLSLRFERIGDSVTLYKNSVAIAAGTLEESLLPVFPLAGMLDGTRIGRVTVDFAPSLNARIKLQGCTPDTAGQLAVLFAEVKEGTPPYHYHWSTGDTTATVVVPFDSLYSVTVTDSEGDSTVKKAEPKKMQATLLPGRAHICYGSVATLTASGGDSYLWSTGDTTAVIEKIVLNDTVYRVTVTSAGGCSDTLQSVINSYSVLPPPTPPAPQAVCADTIQLFTWDSIAIGFGANQLEWSAVSNFDSSNFSFTLSLLVGVGSTDTLWLRSRDSISGCVSEPVYTTAKVNYIPSLPSTPTPQVMASDTPYTFVFTNILADHWSNRLEWTFDSSFTSVYSDTFPATISFTLYPDTFVQVWLRSIDTTTGCTSDAKATIAILDTIVTEYIPYDSIVYICEGTSADISIAGTSLSKFYELKRDFAVLDSAFGNDSTLTLNTGNIEANTVVIVFETDTSLHTTTAVDTIVYIAIAPVDTPEFVIGDTLLSAGDSSIYLAAAAHSFQMIYSMVDGGAEVDSSTGLVYNVTSDFIIKATALGLPGCGVTGRNLKVYVTEIGMPNQIADKYVVTDSQMTVSVTLDTIFAGAGAYHIEWADNEYFTRSHIRESPAVITLNMEAGTSKSIWYRSRNYGTGKVSLPQAGRAAVYLPMISAGLLDKSGWKLIWNDEFNYTAEMPVHPDNALFRDRWALNDHHDNFNPARCENHCNWWNTNTHGTRSGPEEIQYYNYGNKPLAPGIDGSGGEVTFTDGFARLKATKLKDANGDPAPYHAPSCTDFYNNEFSANTFHYKSGQLCSKRGVELSSIPGMLEARVKFPADEAAWPTIWFPGTPEIDLNDQFMGAQTKNKIYQNVIDWGRPKIVGGAYGCINRVTKQTPCDYTEDWHTIACVWSTKKITFFADGKETYSINIADTPDNVPIYDFLAPLLVSFQVFSWAWFDEAEYLVDYVRYYQPSSTNSSNPPRCLLNNAKTLEIPTQVYVDPPDNLRPIKVMYGSPLNLRLSKNVQGNKLSINHTGGNSTNVYYSSYDNAFNPWCFRINNLGGFWSEQGIIPKQGATRPKDYFTPNNADGTIFFQNYYNKIRYYKKVQVGSAFEWKEMIPFIDQQPTNPVPDCLGNIFVDNRGGTQERVWWRGADGSNPVLWSWNPASGFLSNVPLAGTNNGNQNKDVWALHNCGCLIFYRGTDNKLKQMSWGINGTGAWAVVDIPLKYNNEDIYLLSGRGTVTIDEANAKVYFIGADHAVYSYTWDFNKFNPSGLFKLGNHAIAPQPKTDPNGNVYIFQPNNNSVCSQYYNAESDLTLSHDGQTVYYKATDGNLWYYFNDRENSSVEVIDPDNPNAIIPVSQPNWNKTPLKYNSPVDGLMVLEHPYQTSVCFDGTCTTQQYAGSLVYVGENKKLYLATWVNADNPITCPLNAEKVLYNASYKTDGSDTVVRDVQIERQDSMTNHEENVTVTVYPNPSENTFNISIAHLETGEDVEFSISEAGGGTVYNTAWRQINTNGNHKIVWDAQNVQAGVYIYQIKTRRKSTFVGRLVKL